MQTCKFHIARSRAKVKQIFTMKKILKKKNQSLYTEYVYA